MAASRRAFAQPVWLTIVALATFFSAFLLFQVQPLMGKFILPWFGGGPGVWTTCLLFFQVVLLAGYAYAYGSVRWLSARGQALVHLGLLMSAVLCLPVIPDASWKPAAVDHPTWRILGLLTVCLGLPYFVLASTGPLLQAWFSRVQPGVLPYRLYAVSNVGSLLALVSYPFVFEPALSRQGQGIAWSWGLVAFALLCGACAVHLWRSKARFVSVSNCEQGAAGPIVSTGTKWLWLGWPASASVLLLATTNKICQDIAVIPFLLVLPLGIYLLSFILCFDSPHWYRRRWYVLALWPTLGLAWWALSASNELGLPWLVQIGVYSTALFICCMICHGELYRVKPPPVQLTAFYLSIAAGGALGGLFVSVIAPWLFSSYLELPLGWWLCVMLIAFIACRERVDWTLGGFRLRGWVLAALGVLIMAALLIIHIRDTSRQALIMTRNFYGVLRVMDFLDNGPALRAHLLLCGEITHGFQFVDPELAQFPTSYYHLSSGIGLAFRFLPRQEQRRVGVVGLGIGTLAVYGLNGDVFRFYEINPEVKRLAETHFGYLTNSAARVEVVMGDARIALERESPQSFDLLVLDAFNGDAIPVHLLTREAFDVYLRHLKPDGVLAIHVTNRHLNLSPVIAQVASYFALRWTLIEAEKNPRAGAFFATKWVLMTHDRTFLEQPDIRQAASPEQTTNSRVHLWTDDYASLLPLLKGMRLTGAD